VSLEVSIAEGIARKAHAGQKEESTGEDYIKHVERVVALVEGDDAKAAAWLHDVIEDSPVTEQDLRNAGISEETLEAVFWLSRDEKQTYAEYIQLIKQSGNDLAIAVKIADLRDHLRPNCPPRLRPRYEAALKKLAIVSDSDVMEAGRRMEARMTTQRKGGTA
jgi:(p)ppGpp synthase/HD superfamily hydrolase